MDKPDRRRQVHTIDDDVIIDFRDLAVDIDTKELVLQAIARLQRIEDTVSALSDAVDALVSRVSGDTAHLLDLIAQGQAREVALQGQVDAALANDAADAATIAQAQADAATAQSERDAALADATTTIERLNTIDPVADFPAVEPPPEG